MSVTTKHTSLHWACNRHLLVVGLPDARGQTGNTEPGDIFWLRQGLLLGYSGTEGVSPKIILESLVFSSLPTLRSLLDPSELQGGSFWITYDSIVYRSWPIGLSLASVKGIVALSFLSYYILSCFIYEDVGKPADLLYDGSYRNLPACTIWICAFEDVYE